MPKQAEIDSLKALVRSCRRGELFSVQTIMSSMHEISLLAHIDENSRELMTCLTQIETAYKSKDYLYLADLVEYRFLPLILEENTNGR